ncbi:TonB-dependent receptor [Persicobacter psychrovividus]|uniref:SusC/RagA family TonB-linked outer membrane protein n=1 Tax=Persicobacter psychrovividus TaxID=387638 RepID=A0ABN6LGF3_9BACT|nr:SusC/RagA family TonB-linked outer membrane protein [Persicobacter psychrovividus]
MKKLITVFFIMLYVSLSAYAQRQVTGAVSASDTGEPIPGVNVLIKGSGTGTITDFDGKYTLSVSDDQTLQFSFIGMQSKEILVGNQSTINVQLDADVTELDEVMVVAYGVAKKSAFTGSASFVDEERIQTAQVTNVSNALQGTSSGVQVISASGQPGESASVRIRGVGSINSGSDPLYVVDGVPFDGDLSSINPTDIKSMTVMKDAASAAIYGSRAANGLIMITTKSGLSGTEPKINIRSTMGVSSRAVKPIERLGTNDYMELKWEAMRNGFMDNGQDAATAAQNASNGLIGTIGINPYGTANPQPVGVDGRLKDGLNPLWDDNWDEAVIGSGKRYETNLSINGGSKRTQYFLSGSYLNESGMMLGSGFERFTTRLKLTNKTTNWLTTSLNLNYARSQQLFNDSQDSNVGNGATYGLNMASFYPIYQRNPQDGSFITDRNGNKKLDFGTYRTSSYARTNLMGSIPMSVNERNRDLISVRGSADFDIAEMSDKLSFLKGLKFKTSYNTDISFRNNHTYTPAFLDDPYSDLDVIQNLQSTSASRSNQLTQSYTFNNVLSYQLDKGQHSISAIAGQEIYAYKYTYNYGSRSNFPVAGVQEPSFGSQIGDYTAYTDYYSLASFFGRVEYSLSEKYNLSVSYRADGSSRFHKDNRWGNFWSVGGAWNISKEDFMDQFTFLDNLKLKASYGAQGNQDIRTESGSSIYYAYQNLYAAERIGSSSAVTISRLANDNVTWETNLNANIGMDFGMFENRLRGNLEWFQRKSKDLIYEMPLAPSTGFTGIISNVGEMRNRGVELELNGTLIDKKDFSWNLGFNVTHYKNVITDFPIEEGVISGTKRLMTGDDRYAFYLREFAGNSQIGEQLYDRNNDGDIVEASTPNPGGLPTWYLIDEQTGERYKSTNYNEADRVNAGSALPDFFGGVNTSLRYKNFTVTALLSYSVGGKIYTGGEYTTFYGTGSVNARPWAVDMLNRWTPDNQDSDLPRLTTSAPANGFTAQSTRHLYDASYVRLKNLNITYALPESLINRLSMSACSVFVQGENLFTIFGVDGIDPETGGLEGVTGYRYPAAKVISGGINLSF